MVVHPDRRIVVCFVKKKYQATCIKSRQRKDKLSRARVRVWSPGRLLNVANQCPAPHPVSVSIHFLVDETYQDCGGWKSNTDKDENVFFSRSWECRLFFNHRRNGNRRLLNVYLITNPMDTRKVSMPGQGSSGFDTPKYTAHKASSACHNSVKHMILEIILRVQYDSCYTCYTYKCVRIAYLRIDTFICGRKNTILFEHARVSSSLGSLS